MEQWECFLGNLWIWGSVDTAIFFLVSALVIKVLGRRMSLYSKKFFCDDNCQYIHTPI